MGRRPVTPPGAPPHDVAQPYLLLMRARDWAWWRPVLGLLLFVFLYLVASIVVVLLVFLTGVVPELQLLDLLQPAVLLLTNASLIVAIPIVWMCWAVAHGLRIGWSSSVLGRLRWRLLLPWTVRVLPTVGVTALVVVLLEVVTAGGSASGPDASYGWLVLVVLTTTPLQAAAEEYVFRGYLSQALAGWVRHPRTGAVLAAVVTAALFSALHAPPDFATFFLRFGFGLAASAAVWFTGGLEAAIVMHAVYNMTLFLAGGALGTVSQTSADPGTSFLTGWFSILLLLAGMGLYVLWVARSRERVGSSRGGVALSSPAVDLRPQAPAGAGGNASLAQPAPWNALQPAPWDASPAQPALWNASLAHPRPASWYPVGPPAPDPRWARPTAADGRP